MSETFSVKQAHEHAIKWCARRLAWAPICDLGETDQYYVQWDELKQAEKDYWESEYGYNEFATRRCKVETGFMSGNGEFYADPLQIPWGHNFMMMFRIGTKARAALSQRAEGGDHAD